MSRLLHITFILYYSILCEPKCTSTKKVGQLRNFCAHSALLTSIVAGSCLMSAPEPVHASIVGGISKTAAYNKQSPRWELSRQKRTAAIKLLEEKGMVQIDTDESGNQFLNLPWLPNQKILYKSLSISQRLRSEVFAGAFGELAKDCLLHPVDTAKTRRQSKKKGDESTEPTPQDSLSPFETAKLVLMSSVPQGSAFFLVKKGLTEVMNSVFPSIPKAVSTSVPIGVAVMSYWLFRTPAEVIKTKVQTRACSNITEAFKDSTPNGLSSLYKHYNVMLWLDIPFQIINFVLYGILSDALIASGYDMSIGTRLFSGITCGMIAAAFTCPIDTCKTRMIRGRSTAANVTVSTSTTPVIDVVLSTAGDSEMLKGKTGDCSLVDSRPMNGGVYVTDTTDEMGGTAMTLSAVPLTIVTTSPTIETSADNNVVKESVLPDDSSNLFAVMKKIYTEEGPLTLFSGIKQRLLYTGLANGIRLAVYGTARMDLMMRSLDDI
eukprot:gene1790-3475_t